MLRVRLLGDFAVQVDGQNVGDGAWRRRKARTLVKLLALTPGHALHRDQVVEVMWPDTAPQAGLNNLHQALFAARRALDTAGAEGGIGERYLLLKDDMLVLGPNGEVAVDAEQFEAGAALAERTQEAADLHAAVGSYGGELLPADRYEPWSESRREALRRRHHALVASLADRYLREGEPLAAIAALEAVHADDPLDEPLCRVLLRAYLAADRRSLALATYRNLVAALRDELDASPEPETLELGRQLATTPMAAGVHEGHEAVRAHNLPLRLSSFVGRARELQEVRDTLRHTRLLTLTGPGGCGKSRLAIELGEQLLRTHPGGVYIVELAALSEAAAVARAVAATLDVPQSERVPPERAAARHIASRAGAVLLLLDNCEHLIDAAAATSHELLTTAANLTIVATSRQPLRLPGEVVWRVPSLSLPDSHTVVVDELLTYEAVQLFSERARAAAPRFAITPRNAAGVATLCRRLDGLPLALELAAARLRTMPLSEVVRRLDDRFALLVGGSRVALNRQQTLRATVDWSYELLTEPERLLLRRLAVFAGGFTGAAAEAVCADDRLPVDGVVETLADLVDRSLVVAGEQEGAARYRLLETIREYAIERLSASGEVEAVRRRHAAWVMALAELAAPELAHTGRPRWLRRLAAEQGNLRAALDHLMRVDPPGALALARLLWRYWFRSGRLAEGVQALNAALDAVPEPTPVRAAALLGVCGLSNRGGRISEWDVQAEERLEIFTALGDPRGISRARYYIGVQAWLVQELERAIDAFQIASDVAANNGLSAEDAAARYGLAAVAAMQCRFGDAEAGLADVLECVRDLVDDSRPVAVVNATPLAGRPPGSADHRRVVFEETAAPFTEPTGELAVGYVIANLGSIARETGDFELARDRFEQALRVFEDVDDDMGVAMALVRLGNLAGVSHELPRAYALLEAGLRSYRRARDARGVGQTIANLGYWIGMSGDIPRGRSLLEQSEARFRESGDRPGLYAVVSHLGALALVDGQVDTARRWCTEAVELQRLDGARTHLGWALVNLAETSRRAGDAHEAAGSLTEARGHFVFGSRPDGLARCEELLDEL